MAYMSQENKKNLAPKIKNVLKKYAMKGTIAVRNYSTLVVNIKEGSLPLLEENKTYKRVNPYWCVEWAKKDGQEKIASFYEELINAMNGIGTKEQNYDNSDVQTDYFDIGWYIEINVGDYDKPYKLSA